jgi:hypothetical protein
VILSVDIHRAVVALWDEYGLDNEFTVYWTAAEQTDYFSLNDSEARAGQPWPYCIFEITGTSVDSRTSTSTGNSLFKRTFTSTPLSFMIHAKDTSIKTAKLLASELAEEIMKIYGGHPVERPKCMELTHGGVLNVQYQNDFGVRTGDEEYQWLLEYQVSVDTPVAV